MIGAFFIFVSVVMNSMAIQRDDENDPTAKARAAKAEKARLKKEQEQNEIDNGEDKTDNNSNKAE
jgi:hypothetical protein